MPHQQPMQRNLLKAQAMSEEHDNGVAPGGAEQVIANLQGVIVRGQERISTRSVLEALGWSERPRGESLQWVTAQMRLLPTTGPAT